MREGKEGGGIGSGHLPCSSPIVNPLFDEARRRLKKTSATCLFVLCDVGGVAEDKKTMKERPLFFNLAFDAKRFVWDTTACLKNALGRTGPFLEGRVYTKKFSRTVNPPRLPAVSSRDVERERMGEKGRRMLPSPPSSHCSHPISFVH